MTEHLRLVRRGWWILLLAAVGGAACALLVTGQMPVRYAAAVSLMVDQRGSADPLSQQRVKSYARLVTSRRVLQEVATAERLDPATLDVRSEVVPGTVLLRAIVTDGDPDRAARVANRIGGELSGLIHTLERRTAIGVTVIDRATPPANPVSPRPPLNVAAGILLGLVFAYGLLMLRSRLDTTITDSDDLAAATGAPTLGVVGRDRRRPLIVAGGQAEAFRALRTNLRFVGEDGGPRSLLVTSCGPGEGKSTLAINLALAVAGTGRRVALVDADLRRPSVARHLGLETRSMGLTDVLAGSARLAEALQRRPDLDVLPGGPIPADPGELAGSPGMRRVIADLAADHDLVVVDAPPLLPVSDAVVLATACDGVLLVTRAGRTRRESLAQAVARLTRVDARLVGGVLNFAPVRPRSPYPEERARTGGFR
ncbi:polysaccharide biosynthesis tyrosine autokinase [Herbidospora sp. NBRC 101105]|uniref:polysaccharide biosynthesis tyrosine autokinase n=1 Tax=Herbidospora sp. NBRC 101105 TaxID=3032195 RepID=UPI0024A4B897|nr:polysaccharide biosynthesis tyrosine autokinase [Herbidospora sp. NBRC 101105]GLX94233.1 chromosome partitioning protein [Herbidospora sp. NBRC 101105]